MAILDDKLEHEMGKYLLFIMSTQKYKILTSNEVYSIFLEVLKGNNTYPKLSQLTGKQIPQIVQIMQPLIKLKLVTKKPGTGVPKKPTEFIANRKALMVLIKTLLKEAGFSSVEIMKLSFEDYLEKLFVARNFSDLAKQYNINPLNNLKALNFG